MLICRDHQGVATLSGPCWVLQVIRAENSTNIIVSRLPVILQNVIILTLQMPLLMSRMLRKSFIWLKLVWDRQTNKGMKFRKLVLTCSVHSFTYSVNKRLWSLFSPCQGLISVLEAWWWNRELACTDFIILDVSQKFLISSKTWLGHSVAHQPSHDLKQDSGTICIWIT